jgi:hypothetical protein
MKNMMHTFKRIFYPLSVFLHLMILPTCCFSGTTEVRLSAEGLSSWDHSHLGNSVAIDGDYAVVGAFEKDIEGVSDAGAAYIFKKDGNAWIQQAMLIGAKQIYGYFGCSVAIHGDYVVIGASGEDAYHGRVYIYQRKETAWLLQQVLEKEDAVAWDRFGASVSISGDHIIVGAPLDDWSNDPDDGSSRSQDQGAVYVYKLEGENWEKEAKLLAYDGKKLDNFGQHVAIFEDYIIVLGYNLPCGYVFKKTENQWAQMAKLILPEGDIAFSVALNGHTAVIGAPGHEIDNYLCGAVYVYLMENDKWRLDSLLLAGYGNSYDHLDSNLQFGDSVDIKGDYMIISAWGDEHSKGSAYLFGKQGTKWVQKEKLTASDGSNYCEFGKSVSLSGSGAIIGSPRHELGEAIGIGAAYIYENFDYTKEIPYLSVSPPFVEVAASEGTFEIDVKNIGTAGLEWSAESNINWLEIVQGKSGLNDGNVTVKYSGNTGCIRSGTITLYAPDSPNDKQIVQVRQVDGTGYDMVKINVKPDWFGSPVAIDIPYAAIASDDGVIIYKLDKGIWRLQTTIPTETLVYSLDVLDDYMILGNNTAQRFTGAANVYKREGDNWNLKTTLYPDDGKQEYYFGSSVSMSGDYAVIGAPLAKPYDVEQGAAYIFKREGDKWVQKEKLYDDQGSLDDHFGYSVSISGDRVIVGAYNDRSCPGAYCPTGSAFVYKNKNDVWSLERKIKAPYMLADLDWFGYSVSINENRAIIGQPYGQTEFGSEAGLVHMYSSDDNWNTPYTMILADGSRDHFGLRISLSEKYALMTDAQYAYVLREDGSAWKLVSFDKGFISNGNATGTLFYSDSLIDVSEDYAILSFRDNNIPGWEQTVYIVNLAEKGDSDKDGIADSAEKNYGTNPHDADSDDDGIFDGFEDANRNGYRDLNETDPRLPDTDGDGIQDGTELGYTINTITSGTDVAVFIPDSDPSTKTNPLNADTDGDGLCDGGEDINKNGMVDKNEFDPNMVDTFMDRGDSHNMADAIKILKNLSGNYQTSDELYDINGDKKTDLIEVIYLLQKIACIRR